MDSGTLASIGALASLATTLIIAVTAFAALRQIRHNQMANELQIHLHFVNEVNTTEILEAIAWTYDFAKQIKDPDFRERFAQDPPNESRLRLIKLNRFFERYASLVIVSGLSERLIFHEYASLFSDVWDNVFEASALRKRTSLHDYRGRAFEHLAMRAKRYLTVQMPREYGRLERDPRLVALEAMAQTMPGEKP